MNVLGRWSKKYLPNARRSRRLLILAGLFCGLLTFGHLIGISNYDQEPQIEEKRPPPRPKLFKLTQKTELKKERTFASALRFQHIMKGEVKESRAKLSPTLPPMLEEIPQTVKPLEATLGIPRKRIPPIQQQQNPIVIKENNPMLENNNIVVGPNLIGPPSNQVDKTGPPGEATAPGFLNPIFTLPPDPPPPTLRPRGQKCPQTMGRVGIFVVYTNRSVYTHATDVTWCYAISKGYPFYLVQPFEDPLSIQRCGHLQQVKYRKHCAAAAYLEKVDWLLISDGDTGIINADHCLEEYIDPEAEIILYERFFSGEIASGNYFARNTPNARKFIRQWADIELEEPPMPYYFSADNGAIHLQVHRAIYPNDTAKHQQCVNMVRLSEWPNWEPGYGAFVRCVKAEMHRFNATRRGDESWTRLLMVPRAQAWVRDARETWYHYYYGDFMAHGIKETEPYSPTMLARLALLWDSQVVQECFSTEWQPEMVGALLVPKAQLQGDLNISHEHFSRGALLPLYGNPEFIKCWPHCPPDFITYDRSKWNPFYRPPIMEERK